MEMTNSEKLPFENVPEAPGSTVNHEHGRFDLRNLVKGWADATGTILGRSRGHVRRFFGTLSGVGLGNTARCTGKPSIGWGLKG